MSGMLHTTCEILLCICACTCDAANAGANTLCPALKTFPYGTTQAFDLYCSCTHSQPVCLQLTYVTYLSKLEVSQLLEMMQVS